MNGYARWRLSLAIATALCAAPTAAQQADPDGAGSEPAAPRRAPLAAVADVEPRAGRAPLPAAQDAAPALDANRAPPRPTAAAPVAGRAMDTLDLGTTSITGNQELPKVLYIVPWKRSDLGELVGRPANTLLDEVLAPIDHEVFERHLNYYQTLYGTATQEE